MALWCVLIVVFVLFKAIEAHSNYSLSNAAVCLPLLQQLYQTLSDYDIRFYMYEILKVRYFFVLTAC